MSDTAPPRLTDDVIAAFANTPDPRLREILASLVKHLHAFAREVDLTPSEWLAGIRFLGDVGSISTAMRSEFVLLSDTLGVSMMVVALEQARLGAAEGSEEPTEATVEGPFHWPGAPELPLGSDIGTQIPGEPTLYRGRVSDCEGRPVAGAELEVWSSDGEGMYDMQHPEPAMKGRARFRTDAGGCYTFWSIRPAPYPIPDDGPVGAMMRATHRSIYRPAHMHAQVSAPGHVTLITHLFVAGSPHLHDDAVFGKRDSLVVDFHRHPPGVAADGRVMEVTYHSASFDFRLAPVKAVSAA